LGELSGWLTDAGVATVVMESTGVYWRSVYYSLEGLFAEVWLCTTQHVNYVDPGADYFQRRNDPALEAKRLAARIEALGFTVTMTGKAA
jgi:hypothetical protein